MFFLPPQWLNEKQSANRTLADCGWKKETEAGCEGVSGDGLLWLCWHGDSTSQHAPLSCVIPVLCFYGLYRYRRQYRLLNCVLVSWGKVSSLRYLLVSFLPLARASFLKAAVQTASLEDCLSFLWVRFLLAFRWEREVAQVGRRCWWALSFSCNENHSGWWRCQDTFSIFLPYLLPWCRMSRNKIGDRFRQ